MQPTSDQEAASLLQQGVTALQGGDKQRARQYLVQAVQLDPQNDQVWLWLSGVVADDDQRRHCLKQALTINPQNDAARQGLAYLAANVNEQPVEQQTTMNASEPGAPVEQPSDQVPPVSVERAVVQTAGVPVAQAIEQLRPTRRTRPPWLVIVIIVCVLALVVLGALLALRVLGNGAASPSTVHVPMWWL